VTLARLLLLASAACAGALGCQAAPPIVPPSPPAAAGPAWITTPPPAPLAGPPAPAPRPPARELLLPNGLRIVVVEHHRRPVVAIQLLLPRGGLSDPPNGAGLGYLSVKLAGDLREKSPEGEELHWEKTFFRQVVELGGLSEFALSSEVALLEVSGYAQDLGRYLQLLADALRRPRHGERAFGERRRLMLDALDDLETSDPRTLEQRLAEAAFGAGHPYARSIGGTRATVDALGLEDVIAHQARLFVPRGATLLVVGDVEPGRAFGEARAAFGTWTGDPMPAPVLEGAELPAGRAEVGFLRREPASTLVACAARPLPDVAGSEGALDVLAAVIGRGSDSQLMVALRQERGLTYGASAQLLRRRRARAFLACSALEAARAEEGLQAFRQALLAARASPPAAEAVERARALLLADLEAGSDDVAQLAGSWVRALVRGHAAPRPAQERADLERVTAADVHRLARALLEPGSLRWILSGDARVAARAAEATGMGRLRPLAPQR
jgi:predicted Zn-dependent peptidase